MRKIILDGKRMRNREETHDYLKRMLDLPDYYGRNLDALWDLLSYESRETTITFIHTGAMLENLGSYGAELMEVFYEVNFERCRVHIEFE